jgi:hypothetical protein
MDTYAVHHGFEPRAKDRQSLMLPLTPMDRFAEMENFEISSCRLTADCSSSELQLNIVELFGIEPTALQGQMLGASYLLAYLPQV